MEYAAPIPITRNTKVRARARVGNVWSGVVEATYIAAIPALAVSEVMYLPAPPPEASPYGPEDFEFVELENIGTEPLPLAGVQLTDSVRFTFGDGPPSVLAPGRFVVVVKNLEAFSTRYDTSGIDIAGQYTGSLSNSRGTIGLKGAVGETIQRFAYDSSWYPETKGGGPSLVVADVHAAASAWGKQEGWRASSQPGGSPGADDQGAVGGGHLAGDYTGDGRVTVSDAIALLHGLTGKAAMAPPCGEDLASGANLTVLDSDGDLKVSLNNAVWILSYLFGGGPPPAGGERCKRIPGCPDSCAP